jgi:hypothetical protein
MIFGFEFFFTACEVNLATTFRKQLWAPSLLVMSKNENGTHKRLPKRRRQIYIARRSKTPKPKKNIPFTVKV